MDSWQLISSEESEENDWNNSLALLHDFNLYQTFNWGVHRGESGWKVFRWVKRDCNNKVTNMVQVLVKTLPLGVVAAWITGGPAGPVESWSEDLIRLIKDETKSNILYVRMLNNKRSVESDFLRLKDKGWSRPVVKLRSGLSMLLDLKGDLEQAKQLFSKIWKRNLRKAEKNNLNVVLWKNPDLDQIYALYQSMQNLKGLDEQFSMEELEGIFKCMAEYITIYKCTDENGELIAIRGCFILGEYGWDLFAAASLEARKVSATYVLLWRLISHCKSLGVKTYDLMGIDPENNPGVYNFKKGTGAKEIEYLGEWEWASMPLVKFVINLAMKYKLI